MAIRYCIDAYQVFRGMLFAEGWGCDGPVSANPELLWQGERLAALIERVERPDVCAALPEAPLESGFRLRAMIAEVPDAAEIVLKFQSPSDSLEVAAPYEPALSAAYSHLHEMTESFSRAIRDSATPPTVLEIGSRARSGNIRRQMFGEANYIGLDIAEGENVDVVGDAHALTQYFGQESIDYAYSVSVFEHLMWPWLVSVELAKVMKVGGRALMQSHAAWPKHEVPWDFFRFNDSGWRALFCEATGFRVLCTVEAHPADLVSRPFTGSPVHDFRGQPTFLASAVLAEKIAMPTVRWDALPPLDAFGSYPH